MKSIKVLYTEDLGYVAPPDVVPGGEAPQPGQIEK
jgi:hypothetical protein